MPWIELYCFWKRYGEVKNFVSVYWESFSFKERFLWRFVLTSFADLPMLVVWVYFRPVNPGHNNVAVLSISVTWFCSCPCVFFKLMCLLLEVAVSYSSVIAFLVVPALYLESFFSNLVQPTPSRLGWLHTVEYSRQSWPWCLVLLTILPEHWPSLPSWLGWFDLSSTTTGYSTSSTACNIRINSFFSTSNALFKVYLIFTKDNVIYVFIERYGIYLTFRTFQCKLLFVLIPTKSIYKCIFIKDFNGFGFDWWHLRAFLV